MYKIIIIRKKNARETRELIQNINFFLVLLHLNNYFFLVVQFVFRLIPECVSKVVVVTSKLWFFNRQKQKIKITIYIYMYNQGYILCKIKKYYATYKFSRNFINFSLCYFLLLSSFRFWCARCAVITFTFRRKHTENKKIIIIKK